MKILFDYQVFCIQNYGGISKYFVEVIKNLREKNIQAELPILYSNNENITRISNPFPFFKKYPIKGKGTFMRSINKAISLYHLKNLSPNDIFHPTYYDTYFLPFFKTKKQKLVITIHDLIDEFFYNTPDNSVLLKNRRQNIENAHHIFTVSENTKRDLMDYFKVPSENITVTPLASSFPQNTGILMEKKDYLLFVGNRGGYKNFSFLLSAIAEILQQYQIKLLCLGGGDKFDTNSLEIIEKYKINALIEYHSIHSEAELYTFYQQATGFIFPSLYEGFGLPMVEAMSAGCPILASNTGSLPEVGGEAALYFDPKNSENIRQTLLNFLDDLSLRKTLERNALKRSSFFSWEKTTQKTLEVYQAL